MELINFIHKSNMVPIKNVVTKTYIIAILCKIAPLSIL